jgi:hypothetical protein
MLYYEKNIKLRREKVKKKIFFLLLFLTIFVFPKSVMATTATPTFKKKLTWNIESVYYYLTSTATDYSNLIRDAADNWVHTGYGYNKLYPNTRASKQSNGTVDFSSYNDSSSLTIAFTLFFKRANGTTGTISEVHPDIENWLFAEIHINNPVMKSLNTYNQKGTIVHEFGHAWGLAHNQTNPSSVMCQLGSGRKVNTVQEVDNNAFNSKY